MSDCQTTEKSRTFFFFVIFYDSSYSLSEKKKFVSFLCSTPVFVLILSVENTQPAVSCSKLTIETLEQGVGYVQS